MPPHSPALKLSSARAKLHICALGADVFPSFYVSPPSCETTSVQSVFTDYFAAQQQVKGTQNKIQTLAGNLGVQ